MSNDYTRVAITEARDGDEVYQAGEWHRIDGATPMTHSSNVHVRFTNGGSHNAPAHHFTARRPVPAAIDYTGDGYTPEGVGALPVSLEARCTRCGETFNPADDDDLTHLMRHDGVPCDGAGVLIGGVWR